jgi:DNA-binding winged helix-turn-helix (wHTH) protein
MTDKNVMNQQKYYIGDYEFCSSQSCLIKDSIVIPLDKKNNELLKILCSNYPEVSCKDDLLNELWPEQIVSESSLSRLISDTRFILNDNGRKQSSIKTCRGDGFALTNSPLRDSPITAPLKPRLLAINNTHKKSIIILVGLFVLFLLLFNLIRTKSNLKSEQENPIQSYSIAQRQSLISDMQALNANLKNSKSAYQVQKRRRDELIQMIVTRLNKDRADGYELFFFNHYNELNSAELFVFSQIRAITSGIMLKSNAAMLSILQSNKHLSQEIAELTQLQQHLQIWLNKYHHFFSHRKDMCVLYVGEEDGIGFPKDVDDLVGNWLKDSTE